MSLYQLLNVALQVTAPLLIILTIGIIFKRTQLIDQHFVLLGNKLVFKAALPCLLFLSVATRPAHQTIELTLIFYAIFATLVGAAFVWLVSSFIIKNEQKGVFTQCAFRGNTGIIGLAFCVNAYGEEGLALVSVYLACLTILYNILSVMLLSNSRKGIVINLAKNPLIIAIVLGYLWSITEVALPAIAQTSLSYLAKLTLPLALLCIGASLDWSSLKANHKAAIWCTGFKLIILPLLICVGAILLGRCSCKAIKENVQFCQK